MTSDYPSIWAHLLVNLGLEFDRIHQFSDADRCFQAANKIADRRHDFMTKKSIMKIASLMKKTAEMGEIEQKLSELDLITNEIKRLKAGECRTLTASLFRDLTKIKKEIAILRGELTHEQSGHV